MILGVGTIFLSLGVPLNKLGLSAFCTIPSYMLVMKSMGMCKTCNFFQKLTLAYGFSIHILKFIRSSSLSTSMVPYFS